MTREQIGERIRAEADSLADAYVATWRHQRQTRPWFAIPGDVSQDHLPDLLRAMAGYALLGEFPPDAGAQVVHAAAEHGLHRRQEGVSEEQVTREHELLRESLWSTIQQWGAGDQAAPAVLRIDRAVTLANTASLLGYHRDLIEARGRWPGAIDDLLARDQVLNRR